MTIDPHGADVLLERATQGDQQALAQLFNRYRERLRALVRLRMDRRLTGRIDPSDVLQEAYLDVSKRIDDYARKPDMPFHLWLRFLTVQRLLAFHRRHLGAQMRDAGQEVSIYHDGSPNASSVFLAGQLAGHLTSPSQAAVREETQKRLESALNQMDPIDREVLALRHFEELTNNEVAQVLGLQKSAASNRYVRALKRLKEILSETTESQEF
jgi:RNA polymerase sigma-70 factor (ECF subfamily)